ncbi:MAG TPA: hypothetical protein PLZ94_13430, partial [Armatimonadota bacterium]|nr:hypothetical protein [Armatimonadota bacterium]
VGPQAVLKLIREISVGEIRKQAERVPRVVICGTEEERESLRALLGTGTRDEADRARLEQALVEVQCPLEKEEILRSIAAQVLFTVMPPDDTLRRLKVPVYRVSSQESLRRAGEQIAENQEEWLLSLGRHLPGLRPLLAEHLTATTSAANAQIALISALPGIVPATQILLPTAAAADIVLLTKNQILLVLKLTAIYGKPVNSVARLWELAPVVGGAFGWRALARELVGAVPGGVGVVAKSAIAYAGTYTVGRAAQLYYERGKLPSVEERKRIYQETLDWAKEVAARMYARLRPNHEKEHGTSEG